MAEALSRKISHEASCAALSCGGLCGFPVSYMRMKKLFAWQGMKSAVLQFVRACTVCQQAKPDRSRLPGLLQPLSVPSSAWQVVSMDFVEGYPPSIACWSWWISSQNMVTLFLFAIRSRQLVWPSSSCCMSIAYMGCHLPLSPSLRQRSHFHQPVAAGALCATAHVILVPSAI